MDNRIVSSRVMLVGLCLAGVIVVAGCKEAPVKWPVDKYVCKFEKFIAENSVSNLVVATHIKSDWCCLHDKYINIISYSRVIYSFDDDIHTGDTIVRWGHSEENINKLWQSSILKVNASKPTEAIYFVPFDKNAIVHTKYETLIPDDQNPCVQRMYYMRDTIFAYPLEYILNDANQDNVELEPEKAMDAYFILKARYRR